MLGLSWAILKGWALGGGQGAPVAPTLVTAPSLSTSSPVIGSAINATPGVYTGSPTVTAQWFYGDTGAAISGATGTSYTPVSADAGHTLKYIETATNSAGSVASAAPTTGAVSAVASFTAAAIKTDAALAAPLTTLTPPTFSKQAINSANKQVQVDTSQTYQTFQGVGAAITGSAAYNLMVNCSAAQRSAILHEAYGQNGFTMGRLSIGDCDYETTYNTSGNFVSLDDSDPATSSTLPSFALRSDDTNYVIPVAQQILAINPNAKIFAAPWSPPVAVKGINSGSPTLCTGYYVNSATNNTFLGNYFTKFCNTLLGLGVRLYALSMQNEPDVPNALGNGYPYPSSGYAGTDIRDVIKAVGPALQSAGLATKLWAGDTTSWSSGTRVSPSLTDATATQYTDGGCWHCYSGDPAQAASEVSGITGKTYHMTEYCTTTGTPWATHAGMVFGALNVANCSTITWWNLMLGPNGAPGPTDNLDPLISVTADGNGTMTRKTAYYVAAHLGRLTQLGAKRCSATTYSYGKGAGGLANDLCSSAWLNPDGSTTLHLYNANSQALTVQIEDVQGGGVNATVAMNSGDFVSLSFKNPILQAVPDPASITTTTVGSGAYTIALSGSPPSNNGSAITGYDVYEGSGSGAETLVASNQALPYTGSAPNGSVAYVYVRARNAVGAGSPSNELSFTPQAAAAPLPTKALIFPNGYIYNSNFQTVAATTYDVPNGYIDVQIRCNLLNYKNPINGTSALVANYYEPSGSKTNSSWLFGMTSGGSLIFYGYDGSGNFKQQTNGGTAPTLPSGITSSSPVRLRCIANCSASAYNGYAAGTITFLISQDDGNSWQQVGTTATGWTTGLGKVGTSGIIRVGTCAASGGNSGISGKVYGATGVTETGAVIFNPDFTAQNDNTLSFSDTAPTPNAWIACGAASITDSSITATPHTSAGLLVANDMGAAASSPTTGWCLTDLNSGTAATVTAHATVSDPNGGTTASTLSFPATGSSGDAYVDCDTSAVLTSGRHEFEVWLRGHNGGEQVLINVGDSSTANLNGNATVILTTVWQRFRFAANPSSTKAAKFLMGSGSSLAAQTIDVAFPYAA